MLLNCLLGICWFVAPVMLDPAAKALVHDGDARTYVKSCAFSQVPAVVQCEAEPDVLMRSGFE